MISTGLISFQVVAKLNQIDLDMRSIMREYSLEDKEIDSLELLRIMKNQDFKAKIKSCGIEEVSQKYPIPAIVIAKDNSYFVLLKVDAPNKKALIFSPIEKQSKEVTFEEFEAISSKDFIVLSHKLIKSSVRFGFEWFFQEILVYQNAIAEVLVGSFIVQLFGLVTPLFTQVILDKVIVHRSIITLDVLAFAFVAVMLFELVLNFLRKYIFVHTVSKIDAKLGAKLFKHLFALPFTYFESRKVGNIIARVRELDQIRSFITSKAVSVIVDLFFSVVFVFMMFLYSFKLSILVLGFVGLIAILYLVITPELRARLEVKFEMGAYSNSYLVEAVTGIQTVKSLAIEGSMQKKWEDLLAKYIKSSFKLNNMSDVAGAISTMLQKAMTISILYFGVKLVIANKLTIGQLIAFQMFSNQFTGPVLRLVGLWNEFQQTLLGIDRLGDILNNPIEVQTENAITLPTLHGAVKFDKVCFKYLPSSPYVVDEFSYEVKPGMSVGIVGRSGSGKSTITKLIQRLYITNEGAIFVDGVDIRHMNPSWLRHNIGVVLQDNYLFAGTIRENIAQPMPDAPIEHIINMAHISGAHEFISQLPEGYDTIVGERGSTLSGGQRQRVAIARALITNPRILILDEATSALDYESEKIILTNLNKITQGRTTFIIAHRLSNVRHCHVILVMDKGKIIEKGTHEELIRLKGYYHFLNSQQESMNV